MREIIVLIAVGFVYTVSMMGAGALLTLAYFQRALPAIERQAYVQGMLDCSAFAKAQEDRDQLQGVDKTPRRIK